MRIQVNCGCEDAPCCGCNEVILTGQDALDAIQEEDDMIYLDNDDDCDEPDDRGSNYSWITSVPSAGCDDMMCEGYDED